MHLERFKTGDFRNLRGLDISFTRRGVDATGEEVEFRSHAVIGHNGSGKSNLLEALITVFRDLDLNEPASFDYELTYLVPNRDGQEQRVQLRARKGKRPDVQINGRKSSTQEIQNNPNSYLPSHIFAYYSGRSDRVEGLFQEHIRRFNELMHLSGKEQAPLQLLESPPALREHQRAQEKRRKSLGEDLLRRLFYCRPGHTQLVLLACLLSEDKVFAQLLQDLNIVEVDSALFVLKRPHSLKDQNQQTGDSRFWHASGTVVTEFLDKLWEVAVAPIDHTESKLVDFRGRREEQELLYLFVQDKVGLKKLGELVGPPEIFFRYAEGAYIGDLIEEVRINVKHSHVDGSVTFDQLSEGELQLLTVLGLMRITSQDNCLFLLDEPDTHLNPIWKLRYFDEMEKMMEGNKARNACGGSQVIITTHDPLMIGSLRKEQVRILRCEQGHATVQMPAEHPQGMGVAGLLKSDLFGLTSTLDRQTRELLHRRNELTAKRGRAELDGKEEQELARLRHHLEDLGFAHEYRDPLYQLFIEKMFAVRQRPLDELFNPEELAVQEALAEKILAAMVKDENKTQLETLAAEHGVREGDEEEEKRAEMKRVQEQRMEKRAFEAAEAAVNGMEYYSKMEQWHALELCGRELQALAAAYEHVPRIQHVFARGTVIAMKRAIKARYWEEVEQWGARLVALAGRHPEDAKIQQALAAGAVKASIGYGNAKARGGDTAEDLWAAFVQWRQRLADVAAAHPEVQEIDRLLSRITPEAWGRGGEKDVHENIAVVGQ